MPKLDVIDSSKKVVDSVELSDAVFAAKLNESIVHQVVVAQLAKRRSGSSSTKTRSEVRGGGRKPWKQKGLGRARVGSIRSPIWRGGGIAFGPKPRSYSKSVPKKMRRIALSSVLSHLTGEGRFVVVDSLKFDEIKTKKAVQWIESIQAKMPLLVIYAEGADNFILSARNIQRVKMLRVDGLNVYDMLCCEMLICTRDALAHIEKRFVK